MIRIHFLCLAFLGLVPHISGKELYKRVHKGKERRMEEGGKEGGREGRGVREGGSEREGELCPLIVQLSLSVMIKMR